MSLACSWMTVTLGVGHGTAVRRQRAHSHTCDCRRHTDARRSCQDTLATSLPWERILQPSAAREARMSLLQWLDNSGSVACTNCHGFITLGDVGHFRPYRRYRLKVQARTSAGVNSSIALIPEEDHDEQDERQDQAVRTLRPGFSSRHWGDDSDTAGSSRRSHRHGFLRFWLGLRQRPAESQYGWTADRKGPSRPNGSAGLLPLRRRSQGSLWQ